MIKLIKRLIVKIFGELDKDLITRHEILKLLTQRFNKILVEAKEKKEILKENATHDSAMPMHLLTEEFGLSYEDGVNHFSVLLNNSEIIYVMGKGFMIEKMGVNSFNEKKYIRQAEDLLWKRRERIFNFITKPVIFVIAIFTAFVTAFNFYIANTTEKQIQKMELNIQRQEAKIFQLQNGMEAKIAKSLEESKR